MGSVSDQTEWRTAYELLKAGQYEKVAEFLGKAQRASERTGNASLAQILAAARRICLACSQSQAETEWHHRAHQEAAEREDELRQQLQALLTVIREPQPGRTQMRENRTSSPRTKTAQHKSSTSNSDGGSGVWNLFQGLLLRIRSPSQSEDRAPPFPGESAGNYSGTRAEGEAPPTLAVYCLGPFRVYQDDELVNDWPSGKGKCIFKYMIANRNRPISKEILMDLFWRDADPDAARNNLNVAIYGLRQAFRTARPDFSHILFEDDCYLLNPDMGMWVDAEEFVERFEAGQTLKRKGKSAEAMREYEIAEGLYQGDFLEEDLYMDWPIPRREGLKDHYLTVLERLSTYCLEQKRYASCIHLCRKILAKDPCREDAHRRLMRCYSQQGQRNLALRQYSVCTEALRDELEVMPLDRTMALYRQIRSGERV